MKGFREFYGDGHVSFWPSHLPHHAPTYPAGGPPAGLGDGTGDAPWNELSRIDDAEDGRRGPSHGGHEASGTCSLPPGLTLVAPATLAAEPIRIAGTGAATRIIELLTEAYQRQTPEFTRLPNIGSRGARTGVVRGAMDVGFNADPVSPAEAAQRVSAVADAKTGVVFGTAAGTMQATTSQAVIEAYAGKVTKWPDGGLRNGAWASLARRRAISVFPLRLILRPAGDSDNALLRGISPLFRDAVDLAMKRDRQLIAAAVLCCEERDPGGASGSAGG